MTAMDLEKQLAELRPQRAEAVIDLIAQAGADTAKWAQDRNGQRVENPRSNPAYCYEWTFGGKGEPIIVCIWHEELEIKDGRIQFEGNLRKLGTKLADRGRNKSFGKKDRDKARRQAPRCEAFDFAIQEGFLKSLPVRTIILEGNRQRAEDEGVEASKVGRRLLDECPWHVELYEDGNFVLVRGRATTERESPEPEVAESNVTVPYIDQFSLPEWTARRESTVLLANRSSSVREAVLTRSEGRCELCGQEGFATSAGSKYLETHHVVPLAEKGPDVEWNVVALCPNDHRRAHHGSDRMAYREQMGALLNRRYNGALDRLRSHPGWAEGFTD